MLLFVQRSLDRSPADVRMRACSGGVEASVGDAVPGREDGGGLPAWGQLRGGRRDGAGPAVLQGHGAGPGHRAALLAGRAAGVARARTPLARPYRERYC